MNKTLRVVALAALSVAALTPVMAQESPWLVRVRALNIDPANKNTTPVANLGVNAKLIPEVDISYFFSPNIAAELILTYPQKHNIKSGDTVIGKVSHLPPTLTVQYHFMPQDTALRPYVGAGVNYTNFTAVSLPAGLNIKRNSFGWAVQAGLDIPLNKQWSLNFDVKKVQIHADVKTAAGAGLGTLKVDPVLLGVGLGYRF